MLKSLITRLEEKSGNRLSVLRKLQKQLLLADQERRENLRQVELLERIVKTLLVENNGLCLMPPPELRMHVGRVSDAANFWGQGMGSARRVIEIFGENPRGFVLDWGCGSGRTLNWLHGKGTWNEFYRGCDVDAEAIDWLRQCGIDSVVTCGDMPPLPFKDRKFFGVFCFSVLTHIHPQRHRAWYEELHRVLKHRGRAYITLTSDSAIVDRKSLSPADKQAYFEKGWYYSERDGHYKDAVAVSRAFSLKAVEGLFEVVSYREGGYHRMDDMLLCKL